jgi:hypothetical protein
MHRWTWKHDPGPCPVDDAPHTTCVSPDYVPTVRFSAIDRRVTAPLRRPGALPWPAPPVAPPAPLAETSVEVSTKTYRGRVRKDR